jgi:hypothetical protein
MMSNIAFEIPAELLGRVASGELVRYGTILKDSVTGQVVRHLQETGIAQAALSKLAAGPLGVVSMVADVVNAGASIYTGVKVNQLKAMMETLQSLQVATLGVSLAGVGVSVAGFYYMHKRFNSLEGRMEHLGETIRAGFESLGQRDLRKQLHLTKSLLQRAQQAQSLSDPHPEYSEVAAGLADQAAYFEGEIAFIVKTNGPIDLDTFWQLTQMLMLCNSVRIDCRIRTNELRHALAVSESVSSEYNNLFTHLTPLSFGPAVSQGLAAVRVLRDASDAAASKPYLIDYLRTQRINGGDYIEAIDQEKSSPYLLLKTDI